MKNIKTCFFATTFLVIFSSCSYISGPDGLFPETKNKFFEEELHPDLVLPSEDVEIVKMIIIRQLPKLSRH